MDLGNSRKSVGDPGTRDVPSAQLHCITLTRPWQNAIRNICTLAGPAVKAMVMSETPLGDP